MSVPLTLIYPSSELWCKHTSVTHLGLVSKSYDFLERVASGIRPSDTFRPAPPKSPMVKLWDMRSLWCNPRVCLAVSSMPGLHPDERIAIGIANL